ncbi:DUF3137 domain-containing protein [Chitinilyticum piscinae]|uniref:DUF3137 domain-containing protein n=1 Tax=Chitinilyticum piscinae TaxID=2866724 RepID=A0A8J7K9D3_9NEIS|nr:DUF3137 domain-containing protein [Chitinilyticum piscinae]MBE9607924.1 DUF3137 domain-containing protein [Chitinilyticum piscinae]
MSQLSPAIRELLARLESERAAEVSRDGQYMLWAAGGTAVLTIIALIVYGELLAGAIPLGIGALVTGMLWLQRGSKTAIKFKLEVLPALLAELAPQMHYDPARSIAEDEFAAAGFFNDIDRYSSSGWIGGRVGDTALHFGYVHAEESYQEPYTDSQGKRQTRTKYRTLFKGIFLSADNNKAFYSRTRLQPGSVNALNNYFGSYLTLEDPEFNAIFKASSDNEVEARYLLTPSTMERFKALHERFPELHAAYRDSRLLLALPASEPFQVDGGDSFLTGELALSLREELQRYLGVVDALDLNTRIWSKAPERTPERATS